MAGISGTDPGMWLGAALRESLPGVRSPHLYLLRRQLPRLRNWRSCHALRLDVPLCKSLQSLRSPSQPLRSR